MPPSYSQDISMRHGENTSSWKYLKNGSFLKQLCQCLGIISAHIVLILRIYQKLSGNALFGRGGIGKYEDDACKVTFKLDFRTWKSRVDFFKFGRLTSLKIILYVSWIIYVLSHAAWNISDSFWYIPKLK